MAKHTPPGDNSFTLSLLKHGGAAVALVLVVAAAFWGVGRAGDDETEPVAAGQASTEPAAATTDPATEAPSSLTPATEAPATATPTEAATTEAPAPAPTPTEEATTDAPAPAQSIDPASVSVQVLDAVLDDAGVGAQGWADQLEADGYRVIVVNKASVQYDVTTVFYTPGNEAAARQIAVQYGFDRVDLRPDNLSDSVTIHLVVGKDA